MQWVGEGRVRINGKQIHDPETPVLQGVDRISVDGHDAGAAARLVIMLNKPRGLVTTAQDEHARATVYQCLEGSGLPWLAPVGRLDKASEGLLLFSNDPAWAARITSPASGPDKTYHVQIDRIPDAALLATIEKGVRIDDEYLSAKAVTVLRSGTRNAWLEIRLTEGRNRQIRRLLSALDVAVLRLVRVAVGTLVLGDLPKAAWRLLTSAEVDRLLPRVSDMPASAVIPRRRTRRPL
jgi:23S rRNA pseudouridine2605 synthase